jgi:hypothetical protein
MKGLEKELKSHESKPASKGHKGLKTGGVALGNAGGYKKGGDVKMAKGGVAGNGIINTEKQGGAYRNTMMHTAKPDHSPAKTGGVKNGNGGGYKTGGVTKSNAGGYKMGGSTKKAYAAGGTVNSGKPVAMTEGRKPVPSPVRINQLAGTYKNGGRATPAEARLLKNNKAENATAMREAKTQSNLKYGSPKRMADGGRSSGEGAVSDHERRMMDELYFDKNKVNPKSVSDRASRELEEALNPLGMVKELYGKARNAIRGEGASSDEERFIADMLRDKPSGGQRAGQITDEDLMRAMRVSPSMVPKLMELRNKGQGSVTEREKSITVSPAGKKRGGRAC